MSSSSRQEPGSRILVHRPHLLPEQSASAQSVHNVGITSVGVPESPACQPSDTPAPSSPEPSTSPISVLRQFLSYDAESAAVLRTHTPNTLRSLYLSARSQKHLLTSDQLSSLISLFGSLSIGSPHTLRPLLRDTDHTKPYLGFLWQLIHDQRILRHELGFIDRYWIMRLHLFRMRRGAKANLGTATHELYAARGQYRRVRHIQEPSDVHVCFAETLLACGVSDHLPEVVDVLCDMLNFQLKLDHAQLALMWKVILTVGSLSMSSPLSSDFRMKILDALHGRFRTMELEIQNCAGQIDSTGDSEPDIHDLVSALRSTMLLLPSTKKPISSLLSWAVYETRIALFPSTDAKGALALSWRNLYFIALVCSPLGMDVRVQRLEKDGDLNAADWQVVCILAILDRLLQQPDGVDYPRQILDGIVDVLEPIWDLWIQDSKQNHERPIAIDRAIAVAIFRFAGVVRDRSLQISCYQYAKSHGFWFRQESSLLQVESALASISCGEHDWLAIFPDLQEHTLSDRVVEETISRCSTRNVASAHELYVYTRQHSIELSSNTIAALGKAAATTSPEFGIVYLNDRRLSSTQLQCILETILKSTSFVNVKHSPKQLFMIGEAMLSIYAYSCPSSMLRGRIKDIMLTMMRTSTYSGLKAVQIMAAIYRTSADFLGTRFISIGLQCLLSRRFYRVAYRLFRFAATAHVGRSRRWQKMLIMRFAHGKAHALARQTYNIYPNPVLRTILTISLLRIVDFDIHHPTRVAALKIYRKVKDKDVMGGKELGFVIKLLVRGRRMLAAKALYARHQVDDASRTVAGNTILHASFSSPKRQNSQRIRKILRTLQELKNDYGFVPDRITINIFIKGILLWDKVMDSERLKGLFDHLISSGYPGSLDNGQDSITKPFGTKRSFLASEVPLVDSSMPVLFTRHARPLYNMFIKAFHRRGDREAALVVVGVLKRAAEGRKRTRS